MDNKSKMGARLRVERERKGLSQEGFGAIGGVGKKAQFNYEKGERFPDAQYFSNLLAAGIDIEFILIGKPSIAALTPDEIRLLTLFRSSSIELKVAAIAMLDSGSTASTGVAKQIFHGNVGQKIEGDSYNAQIDMSTNVKKTKK